MSADVNVLFDVPGPRARTRHRLLAVVGGLVLLAILAWVLMRMDGKGQLDPAKWAKVVSWDAWRYYLLPGLRSTLVAALLAIVISMGLAAFVLGLALGAAVGGIGFLATRFEHAADGTWYTPNRWLVLALTALLAARLALGLWRAWRPPAAGSFAALLADHAQLFGLGGVLLGYALSYAWLLRARARR